MSKKLKSWWTDNIVRLPPQKATDTGSGTKFIQVVAVKDILPALRALELIENYGIDPAVIDTAKEALAPLAHLFEGAGMSNSPEMKKTINKVLDGLLALSPEKLRRKIDEHKMGDFGHLLLPFLEAQEAVDPDELSKRCRAHLPTRPQDWFAADRLLLELVDSYDVIRLQLEEFASSMKDLLLKIDSLDSSFGRPLAEEEKKRRVVAVIKGIRQHIESTLRGIE